MINPDQRLLDWLQAVDLSRVAISAALDEYGNLRPVGGIDAKQIAAFDSAAKLGGPRVLIVSDRQPEIVTGDPRLEPDAFPLRIIKVPTLTKAVESLYEDDGPRHAIRESERAACGTLELLDRSVLFPGGAIASDSGDWEIDGVPVSGDVWPIPAKAKAHPRAAGTFCRMLGRYVRERKALTLSDAICRCSLTPAQVLETSVPQMKHKGRIALIMLTILGAGIAGFALSTTLWVSCLMLFISGASLISVFALVNSLVQLITTNEMRGRVMSVYNFAFRGGMPLGNLMTGWLVPMFTAPVVLAVNGVLLMAVAVYFLTIQRRVAAL